MAGVNNVGSIALISAAGNIAMAWCVDALRHWASMIRRNLQVARCALAERQSLVTIHWQRANVRGVHRSSRPPALHSTGREKNSIDLTPGTIALSRNFGCIIPDGY